MVLIRLDVWYDKDVSLEKIKKEVVAVIGYGIQGHAQASNMKDSGLNVIVGLRKNGASWDKAIKDGHEVYEVAEAAKKADIIHILVPDMTAKEVYENDIKPHLKEGDAIGFSHGIAITYNWIQPPEWVDIIMVAPKAPGKRLREVYLEDFGVPAIVAVEQDYTKRAWDRVLGMTKAIGSTRAGAIKTTFKEETETDLFGEQVDLCGGADRLIRTAFEVLVESGYKPEIAYFECLHEVKLIVDLIQDGGITGMYNNVSETARYGGLTRGGRIINKEVKENMKSVLKEVQNGEFASEWLNSYETKGKKSFEEHMNVLSEHPIEKIGKKLRSMMWPDKK